MMLRISSLKEALQIYKEESERNEYVCVQVYFQEKEVTEEWKKTTPLQ